MIAGGHPPRAQPEQGDRPQVREGVEAGLEAGPQASDHEPLAPEILGPDAQAFDLAASRPSVFTSRAPSKLSWATLDTSPTRAWAAAAGRSTRFV